MIRKNDAFFGVIPEILKELSGIHAKIPSFAGKTAMDEGLYLL
jgi:hypothetical protein